MIKHFAIAPNGENLSRRQRGQMDVIGIATFGFFLLLVGVVLVITPGLPDRIYAFLNDFRLQPFAPNIYFPAPRSNHPVLYTAISQFCLAFAVFQVFVLGARFVLKDTVDKKAGTVSSLIFWAGASWILSSLAATIIGWFAFVGLLITLIGISIVAKSSIILAVHGLVRAQKT